jgi:mono/diheme cytochrome c family protein/glucose/arabinose dehydrogenase
MKKLAIPLALLVIGILAYSKFNIPAEPAFVLEEGYRYLYDGKSLDGWEKVGGKSTFKASGAAIIGRHGPGENTFLRTEQSYGDFSLKLQMRWDEPGNSGVMFRAQQRQGSGRVYGYQYELDHSERAWTAGIYDEARRGWLANLENNQAAREAVRLDDWNDVEIEARGAILKTWINGVPAADIIDGLDAQGFIALQVHTGDVGVIRWRHIRIKELSGMAVAGDSLLSAVEWRVDEPASLQLNEGALLATSMSSDHWITSRRKFSDAMVRMNVPACDKPTTIRMRYRQDESGRGAQFAEVRIYANRAEGRLVTSSGEKTFEPVKLEPAARHDFVGVTLGGQVVLSVGQSDAVRVLAADLYERGQLLIQPADCTDGYTANAGKTGKISNNAVTDIDWFAVKETNSEPLFYQTLDTPPAPPLSPEQALAAFKIAPGFEIELVAAEPLIEDPVAMSWDEFGRLYVVELRGYMPDAYGTGSEEPVGQVVRLTDTDGDGRMDNSEVFLGQLVNPRAVAVVNEGVLIGEPPNLWLCELPSADALCEKRRRVGDYAFDVGVANVEHMENGLRQGLDNWLYNAKSARRLRMVDGDLQEEEGLFRGQWGITRDAYGRWLYNHNSTWIQADFFQAEDLVQPGLRQQYKGLGVNLTTDPQVHSVRVNPGVNRAYLPGTLREDGRLNKATGVSGLVAYRGDQFPEQFRGDVFVPESAGNVVAQFELAEDGLALTATQRLYDDAQWGQRSFLGSTDERFRPVDAMNGPDGALYLIDMYRGIIQDDHFLTDELREQIFQRKLETPVGMGRIWRIRHTQGKPRTAQIDLAAANDVQLIAALSSTNGWVRDTSQRLLLARPQNLAAQLGAVAATGDNTLAALHALWALAGRGELSRELALDVIRNGDPARQLHVLRAARGTLLPGDLLALAAELGGASEAVVMQLVFTLGDHTQDAAVRGAISGLLTDQLASRYVRQAAVRAVTGNELVFLQEYLAAGHLLKQTQLAQQLLETLGSGAYRSGRGDLTSTAPAEPSLQRLLAFAESLQGAQAWQQIALLKGFEQITNGEGFEPARLAAPPAIFSDGSIGEKNPLWNARLGGRKAFTWPGDELALGITPLSPEQLQLMALGEAFYPQCSACHGANGAGIEGLAPPLKDASWVTGPPEWLGRIILQGMTGPVEVGGIKFDGLMPPHGHLQVLDDATLAGLMTYLRRSWGNKADPVSEQMVADVRAASVKRGTPWTAAQLQLVPIDRGFSRFTGKYSVSFITMTVSEKPEGLHLSVPMYGSGILQPVGGTVFEGTAGGETAKVEFVVDDDGSVNKMLLYRDGERIPLERKD